MVSSTSKSVPSQTLSPGLGELAAVEKEQWLLPIHLRARAHDSKDRVFLTVDGATQITYGEMLVRAERMAAGLARLGVSKGDRVLLVMDNSAELITSWFAINLLGAVEVPMNVANRGNSLAHVFNNSQAQVAVVDACYLDGVAQAAKRLEALRTVVVHGGVPQEMPWDWQMFDAVANCADPLPDVELSYRDTGAIMYTSGTTGPAKGVVMPHAHMFLFARHVVEGLEITQKDVYMVCLPLFHANAQLMQIYAALLVGAKVALYSRFSASSWLRQIAESGATVSSLLGIMAQFIYNQAPSSNDQAHSLRRMVTIPLPSVIARSFERRFGVTCIEAYGMTEICLPLYRPMDEPLRPGSCGKPLADWFDIQIVDPDTDEPVRVGEVGEIVVRPKGAYTTFTEYQAMPERTVEAWRNLWFHTGDAGRCDEDGYFYFVDRTNDRIRKRGENVTAYDIEVVLCEYPGVVEAAVVAVPAAEGEDDIKAVVVLAPDVCLDPVKLVDHCVPRLPYFSIPRYVEVRQDLPKTPSGKILKRELRADRDPASEWDRELIGYQINRTKAESSNA